jgi:glycosyltransferase involved in cell wall biosynthesis
VDNTIFNSCNNQKLLNKDKFVIFSGGKFEYRKGQDIALKAFKLLSNKYDDVLLVASWFNMWEKSVETMRYSKILKTSSALNKDYFSYINQILFDNKIDLKRVIIYPMMSNVAMPSIYKNSDIGIFPNRCEGGTNLVLMEYMATGKPVIVSNNTGHKDIINKKNAIILQEQKQNENFEFWQDSSVDEVFDKLEYAYLNYKKVKKVGKQASKDMSKLSWKKSAKNFLKRMENDG